MVMRAEALPDKEGRRRRRQIGANVANCFYLWLKRYSL
jgi:hypothetical protein